MKKPNFKYIVLQERAIYSNRKDVIDIIAHGDGEFIFNESSYDNLLEARIDAFKKVESIIKPSQKFGNESNDNMNDFSKNNHIMVTLIDENENKICIYNDGYVLHGHESHKVDVFKDLLKEHEIFKKLNIDINKYEESVTFYDENGKETKGKILKVKGQNYKKIKLNPFLDMKIDDL